MNGAGLLGIPVVAALLVASASPTVASAQGTRVASCARQSQASFHPARAGDLSFGPLRFVGLRDIRKMTGDDLRDNGWFKSPALLTPGHTVAVSIDRPARSFARVDYAPGPNGTWSNLPHAVRFVACSARRAESDVIPGNWSGGSGPAGVRGAPVTFWSGGIVLRRIGVCIPLTIRIDRQPRRRFLLPVGVIGCRPASNPPRRQP